MRQSQFIFFLFLFILMVSGCRKLAFVPPDPSNQKITVNGIFTFDEQLKFQVLSTKSFNDTSFSSLPNLNVDLVCHQFSINADIVDLQPTILSNFFPDQSYTGYYHLKISAEGYDTIYTFARIPEPIQSFAFLEGPKRIYNTNVLKIILIIIDDIDDDYYMIDSYIRIKYKDSTETISPSEIFTLDQKSDNEVYSQNRFSNYSNVYLTDKDFVGSQNGLETDVYIESEFTQTQTSGIDSAFAILRVRHVEENMYKHLLNIDQYNEQFATSPGFETEYVQIHSNISGGFGIFAGYSAESFEFQIYP